jgi:hypothetical protein
MPIDHNQLIVLAEQLDDARTARDKLLILGDMARIIREAQQIYRLVEVIKDQLAEDGHIPMLPRVSATEQSTQAITDLYPHLR